MHGMHLRAFSLIAFLFLAAACERNDRGSYYPLESGRWWQYTTTTVVLDEPVEQKLLIANLGTGKLEGRIVNVQRVQRGLFRYFVDNDDGVARVAARSENAPITKFDPPQIVIPGMREAGTKFTIRSGLRVIESRTFARQDKLRPRKIPIELLARVDGIDDVVETPAGIFEHCLRIVSEGSTFVRVDRGNASAEVTVTQSDWYAPGIGLVKSERTEQSDSTFLKSGNYLQVLERYR